MRFIYDVIFRYYARHVITPMEMSLSLRRLIYCCRIDARRATPGAISLPMRRHAMPPPRVADVFTRAMRFDLFDAILFYGVCRLRAMTRLSAAVHADYYLTQDAFV